MTAIKNGTLLVKDSNGNTARVATLSQTDITTLNTALGDIEANKRKISSISANYVTTNTDQTISAQKTFSYQSEPIHIKETRFDVSKTPSETVGNSIVTYDKNNKQVGYYQVLQESNGHNINSIYAVNYKTDGTLVRGCIRVGVNNNGDTYTYAPNPADDSNNTEIATTKFVNDKISSIGSNYITTNTEQIITAAKAFKTTAKHFATKLKITDVDNTVTPTENLWTNAIEARDKNDKNMGALQFTRTAEGNTQVGIQAANQNSNGQSIFNIIAIKMNNEGVATTYAPTPSSSSNDNNIATTYWVNNKVNPIKDNYVTTNTEQTITGQKTLSTNSKRIATKLKITDVDNTVTPTENLWTNAVAAFDKNEKGMGALQFARTPEGNTHVGIQAMNQNSNGYDLSASISISVNNKGVVTTRAPTPSASSNDLSIATTAWVNDKVNSIGSNYVTTNTAQTITGRKTFTDGVTVLKNTNFDALTTGKGAFVSRIISQDKNGLDCNYINFWQNNDKAGNYKRLSTTSIGVNLNKDDGTSVSGNIHIDGTLDKSGTVNFYAYAPTPDYRSTNNQIATCEWIRSYIMPAGTIIPFAGSSIPTGYLLCNGAVVSRTTYANLFGVIGTTYGAGDGSTTFKLPDLRDRFLEGAGTNAVGRYLSAGLPNITGDTNVAAYWYTKAVTTGCFIPSPEWDANTTFSSLPKNGTNSSKVIWFDAHDSQAIYGASSTVQPASVSVQYLIKY